MKHINWNTTLNRRLAFITVLLLVIFFIEKKLTVVFTESINATILWRTAETPNKGDYANYALDKKHTKGRHLVITKKVQCVEGDMLVVRGKDYYCNGQWLGTAKEKTLKGKPLVAFQWSGIVPEGKVFFMGEHKDSWDSRYWGFAKLTDTEKVNKII